MCEAERGDAILWKQGLMALNQHLSLCSTYPLLCTCILLLDSSVFTVMTRGVLPSATLTVASSKLANPQGWSESLPVCTRCSPTAKFCCPPLSLFLSLLRPPSPQSLAKYLLLIQEINSCSKVMDHNVLMCFPLRCFHFNRGLQCLNYKSRAVVDLLLDACGSVGLCTQSRAQGHPTSQHRAAGAAHRCDCKSL